MQRTFLLGKIHNCRVSDSNLNYMGSIGIDQTLLEAAGIMPYEQVQVLNITTGGRFITYAIALEANSGKIELNGAAARLGESGDRLIILTYGLLTPEEVKTHEPRVIFVDEHNSPLDPILARSGTWV
ncbi:aspartate 1-decarboxylase [Euhalothece natronophila Z-M001]|uniref:Aspartate 1-decarboxylase n=1 Tax=Euhalothece natronophila Z-M001 TaxID=522448 RepID=A0A5B8NMV4_9CHRO|nr:aspartate 1-decarboxylase [Euhalothece natronophila]QDZ40612.1 aspartate 1-decarboxylase [Euhalothece natronophila Z-M001]